MEWREREEEGEKGEKEVSESGEKSGGKVSVVPRCFTNLDQMRAKYFE